MDYKERLNKIIPAGAHTYSRNQFPDNAPPLFKGGCGAYLYTADGDKYLDYGMGLRAVNCGYSEKSIVNAAMDGALLGNCLSRPSLIELEAAELMCNLVGADMVKFTKTGSAATTAAVKLARAVTGRSRVLIAGNHPFFSYDDWFIGSTSRDKGIPIKRYTEKFDNLAHLESIIDLWDNGNEFCANPAACIIMEPKDYDLKAVRALCDKHGVVLIFDEMITGFRYHMQGKQHLEGVKPDLSCWGKAMANGFSVAALTGKREIMKLGAHTDMFLLSTTHGAEMSGLNAFMATVKFMKENMVIWKNTNFGAQFMMMMEKCADEVGLVEFTMSGHSCNPSYSFHDPYYQTLFQEQLVKHKVLMPWLAFSYAHGEEELKITKEAVLRAMEVVVKDKTKCQLVGNVIKPVFA
jgi:glutamate-1-semialdehyde 2,1-aminomutase